MKLLKAMPTLIIAFLFCYGFSNHHKTTWLIDYKKAESLSKASNKMVLISFTGSDWCNNCRKLKKTVLETHDFQTFASESLILLSVDFPARKRNKLSAEQTKHNEAVAEKFNPEAVFPTMVLVKDGKVVTQIDTQLSAAEMIAFIKKQQQ